MPGYDQTAQLSAGRLLGGRYRMVAPIARGGMAEVWEAHDDILSRDVAVKVLQAHLAEDAIFRERFRREAVTAGRLTHPNIVATFDTGFDAGTAYIVMELIKGRNLRQLLHDNGRLEPWQAVAIARQVADALAYAHQAGLIHRDVKPANCLLVEDEWGAVRVKVTDFGIAKAGADAGGDLTKTGIVLGTPKYLSPEQIKGLDPDPRADLYSLGVVLYEMLTGEAPFARDNDMAMAMAHINDKVPRPGSRVKGIPSSLDKLVGDLLAKNPDRRVPSAAALRQRLDAIGPLAAPALGDGTVQGRWRGMKPRFDNGSTPTGIAPGGRTPVPPLPTTMLGPVVDVRSGEPGVPPAGIYPAPISSRRGVPFVNPAPPPPPGPPPPGPRRPGPAGPSYGPGPAGPSYGPPPSVPFHQNGSADTSVNDFRPGASPGRPFRRSERVTGVVVLGLVVMGVLVGVVLAAGGGGHKKGGNTPDARYAALKIANVSVFMANSRPPDDPAGTVYTFDGNPATSWNTDQYRTATFSGLYPGIGLAVELAAGSTVHQLTVTSSTQGWAAEAFVSTTPVTSGQSVTAWGLPTDTQSLIQGSTTFSLGPTTGVRYVLLWISNLGPPPHQVQVAELRVS